MSYTHTKKSRVNYDGKTLLPLSVSKQLLKLRPAIEKHAQHAGQDLELVYQGYKEIQEAHGHAVPKLDSSCSGCTKTMNTMLLNWFKLYDEGTIADKAATGALKTEPLKPLKAIKAEPLKPAKPTPKPKAKETTKKLPTAYADLLQLFNETASDEDKKTINKGNAPKKAQILSYFNGK